MNESFRMLRPFLRGFPLVVLSMVIAVLAAKKYLSYVTPMYESTAKLKLADAEEGVPKNNLFTDFDVFVSKHKIATEIEVLKSNTLISKALDSLDFGLEIYREGKMQCVELYHNSPISIVTKFDDEKAYDVRYKLQVASVDEYHLFLPNTTEPITGRMGMPLKTKYGVFLISINHKVVGQKPNIHIVDEYQFEFLTKHKLIDKINKSLDIVPIEKDVPVIRINVKSNVPEKAALFVNKLAQAYILDYIETKYRAANTTVNFLDEQIKEAGEKLANSENKIEQYRNAKGIVNLTQETETDLRKISQLKIQQTNMKMSLEAIDELNKYIILGKDDFLDLAPNFEAFTDLLSTEIIKNIKRLQAEKKDLLLTYTSEDEKVKVIDLKIKDLTDYLVESINNTKNNLQIKYDQLSNDIDAAKKVFVTVPEKEKMMTILTREFDLYQSSYNFLTEKKIEAEVAQSAKIAFHRVITPAEASKIPVSPIKSIIIIVSAIMGMFGSIVLIYIVHLVKGKVNDSFTIEKNSAIPIALSTPFMKDKTEIKPYFLKAAIQLELKDIATEKSILLFTSFEEEKYHRFHVRYFLDAFSSQGRNILFVDVVGNFAIDGLQHKDNISYKDLSSSEYARCSKAMMQDLLYKMVQDFDLCIINSQSIKNDTLGIMLMSIAHQNLFVLDSRKTAASKILQVDLLKEEFKLSPTSFILNKAGYNPNVLFQAYRYARIFIKRLLKK